MPLGDALSMASDSRTIGVDFGAGPTVRTARQTMAGTCAELSRTVFMYVRSAAVIQSDPMDIEFTRRPLTKTEKFVRSANLVPLRAAQYQDNLKSWSQAGASAGLLTRTCMPIGLPCVQGGHNM